MDVALSNVNPNETATIKVVTAYKCDLPSFGMLVNTERRTKVVGLDMHTILQNASKNASWFFWTLIKKRDPKTNLVVYAAKNKTESNRITKAFKELNEAGVIKRYKRGQYLISPKAFIPSGDAFDVVTLLWEQTK